MILESLRTQERLVHCYKTLERKDSYTQFGVIYVHFLVAAFQLSALAIILNHVAKTPSWPYIYARLCLLFLSSNSRTYRFSLRKSQPLRSIICNRYQPQENLASHSTTLRLTNIRTQVAFSKFPDTQNSTIVPVLQNT